MSWDQEDENFEDEDEPETSLRELAGEERSPVEESLYESYMIQSRTTVGSLYASNVLSRHKHIKMIRDLARQRKVRLSSLEREQKKLLKKMETLKEKQEKNSKKGSIDLREVERAETAEKFMRTDRRRSSLPQLVEQYSKKAKTLNRLTVPDKIISKSCDDLTPLHNRDSWKQGSTLVLPSIKPSRSHVKPMGLRGSQETWEDKKI